MRRFVVGDIHGSARAFQQVLEKAKFNLDHDLLICIGDVCDGWPETKEVIDKLLLINNLVCLLGNHDMWFRDVLVSGLSSGSWHAWYTQGGAATIESYGSETNVPKAHVEFLKNLRPYYELDNKLFVHGGFDPNIPLEDQTEKDLCWNREFWYKAKLYQNKIEPWDDVFLGHTSIGAGPPVCVGNVWNLDTGCGWEGVLTLMDIDSKKYWQSDLSKELYPEYKGRF